MNLTKVVGRSSFTLCWCLDALKQSSCKRKPGMLRTCSERLIDSSPLCPAVNMFPRHAVLHCYQQILKNTEQINSHKRLIFPNTIFSTGKLELHSVSPSISTPPAWVASSSWAETSRCMFTRELSKKTLQETLTTAQEWHDCLHQRDRPQPLLG